jgi:predicted Zn-dependent protease
MLKRSVWSLLIVTMLLVGCATVPLTGRRQLSLVSQSEMVALGAQSYEQFLEESHLSQDARETEMVRDVGTKIALSAEEFLREHGMEGELEHYQWKFSLIEADTIVNAFCMPGGKVAVYSGILPVAQGEDGLAVVVGHEVAHAIANHGGERMSQLLLAQLGGMALSQAVKEQPEKTQQLAMLAYGVGANVGVLLPYSRKHESEADRIGLIIMARAGYDPQTAIPFWKRMNEQGGERPPEFLSTHPAPERRIQDIRDQLPEAMKYYKQ